MRILWYSATPECSSGYGNASRYMARWLVEQGHFVACATKHPVDMRFRMYRLPGTDKDIPILCGTNIDIINRDVMNKWKMDACISMFDVWGLKEPIINHIPWVPIDTEQVATKIINKVKDCPMVIAMTQHGLREMERHGIENLRYAPIGFDPEIFKLKPEDGKEFRESMVWLDGLKADDMFLIGSVGLNYPDDRKGFILLLQAFQKFHEKHDNARLYLHTQAVRESEGINYAQVAKDLGVLEYCAFPDQAQFWFGEYRPETLASMYNGMDVFCLPTRGEGFGMPIIEAQACGTPVIVSKNTSGPELCRTGIVVEQEWDDMQYTGLDTYRLPPRPANILKALEAAYKRWPHHDYYNNESIYNPYICNQQIQHFSWQNVWESWWQPIIDEIAGMLPLVKVDVRKDPGSVEQDAGSLETVRASSDDDTALELRNM